MVLDKFLPPFIDFVNEHFDTSTHRFVFIGKREYKYGLTPEHKVEWIDSKIKVFKLLKYMYSAKKIILHGLWSESINKLLFLQPWLLKKCYWVMWGGDFYFPEEQTWVKKQVIKRMGHFITGNEGDYKYVEKNYGATGQIIKCFVYPSNLYREHKEEYQKIKLKRNSTINIQIGNSATKTNNHIKVLDMLIKYKDNNIKIFVPLSYGDEEYAKEVICYGRQLFGDKFVPLTDFMPFEKYLDFLSKIDIAVFPAKRQQAFGNIVTLLGFGKKVYIDKDSTLNIVFDECKVKVYHIDDFNLELLDVITARKNIEMVKKFFSEKKLVECLKQFLQ